MNVRLAIASSLAIAALFSPFSQLVSTSSVAHASGNGNFAGQSLHKSFDVPMAGPLSPDDPAARLDPALESFVPIPTPVVDVNKRTDVLDPVEATREIGFDVLEQREITDAEQSKQVASDFATTSTSVPGNLGSVPAIVQPNGEVEQADGDTQDKVYGADDRQKITATTSYPWRAQCKLFMTFPNGARYIGSGTLISRKYVITAGHCIYSRNDGGWAQTIEVVPGLNGTYKPYGSAFARYMRSYTGWTQNTDYNHDFGLITLDREIGNTTGWLGYGSWSSINGTTANIAGYPGDRDNGQCLYYHFGPINSSTSFQVFYTVDTYGGQSGSGVYLLQNGNRYVFAVHSGSTESSNFSSNRGTRLDSQKVGSLNSWIASNQ